MNLAEMLAVADQATQGIEINANKEFDLITPGTYDVAVTGAEGPIPSARTNPKNPDEHGQYLKIEFTITGPASSGRKVWMNNNIICFPKTNSPDDVKKCQTAMAMGAKERKVLLDSIGKVGIETAQELIGATCKVLIATEKGTNGYKDKSVVKNVKPIDSSSSPSPVQSHSAPVQTTSAPKAKLPWEK